MLASWFGTGLILRRFTNSDAGSGTLAGIVTVSLALLLRPIPVWLEIGVAVVLIGLSMWAAHPFTVEVPVTDPAMAAKRGDVIATKAGDPGWVVIDEAAGTLVSIIGLATGPAIVGFIVFRIADIAKGRFPGVGAAERLPGGIGVTMDDIVAAFYGLAAGWAVQLLFG